VIATRQGQKNPLPFRILQFGCCRKGKGDNMEEVWKDIAGYEGLYQVSNLGRVKSLERMIPYSKGMRKIPEKIMKQEKNTDGYLRLKLVNNSGKKNKKIHRLVAEAFIPNPEEKKCINHIDGDKSNNCVKNLEWVTYGENMKHAYENGLTTSWNIGKHYHWNKGHSEETKQKLRKKQTGRRYSWGHGHTEETKRHISEAKKNRTKDGRTQ
jgi:hypothetical protein